MFDLHYERHGPSALPGSPASQPSPISVQSKKNNVPVFEAKPRAGHGGTRWPDKGPGTPGETPGLRGTQHERLILSKEIESILSAEGLGLHGI